VKPFIHFHNSIGTGTSLNADDKVVEVSIHRSFQRFQSARTERGANKSSQKAMSSFISAIKETFGGYVSVATEGGEYANTFVYTSPLLHFVLRP